MSDSLSLYDTLFPVIRKAQTHEDARRLRVFVWVVVGLLVEKTISLPLIALAIASTAKMASRTRRLRRFLANPHVCVRAYYDVLIRGALAEWAGQTMYLILDTTTVRGRVVILRVSLVYRGRAVPLAWQVYERKSVSLPIKLYREVLGHVRGLLPPGVTVVLLGDRGFRAEALMRWCRSPHIGWHFRLRLKANQRITGADGRTWLLRELGLQPGQKGFLHDVRLGGRHYGPLHLAMAWAEKAPGEAENQKGEAWYIASDEPTDDTTLGEYGLRMEIEEELLDDKSGGFQLEATELQDAASISRLLLVMSVAYLHVVSLGTFVVAAGLRRSVDGHWARGLSYFQIGWRWLRQSLYHDHPLLRLFRLIPGPDPEPVPVSRARRTQPVWSLWSLASAVT
jgi:hypothetical protein